MKNFYTPFIYKDYNINIGGPNADHNLATMVYEDALPPVDIYTSYRTLRERSSLTDYIRGTFITIEDGERTDFKGGPQSLNSRLKLLHLNPYNSYYFSSNPYKGLPRDMLIYKSCYPIVYDPSNISVQCKKSSVGINMRVYRLTKEEYQTKHALFSETIKYAPDDILQTTVEINKIKQTKKPIEYNVWRDLEYFNYIRNYINKPNHSPNFIGSYCYFLNYSADISFLKNGVKNEKLNTNVEHINSNIAMILLTESSNSNLYSWASDIYVTEKNIKKQTYSGYKTSEVWISIITQILFSFYVMDTYKFIFYDMDIERNFYIKDVSYSIDSKQYWRYKINNIDYYLPNYGYLLLVDHDFHDLNDEKQYKVLGTFLGDKESIIDQRIRTNAKKCINSNNFGSEFKNIGGIRPSENVIAFIDNINRDLSTNKSFEEIIIDNCYRFIHNRVGTLIRESEYANIRKNEYKRFNRGELVIWEEKYDRYKIVLYIQDEDEYNSLCYTRVNNNNDSSFTKQLIQKDLLYHYSEDEIIRQDIRVNEPSYNLDYLIETYNVRE